MPINQKAKKLSALSKRAVKGLPEGGTRAWLIVETEKDSFFYIDKKISDPSKFKDPMRCQKLFSKLKVDGIDDIGKSSPLIAGLVGRGGEGFQIAVTVKKNGAGTSTLKSALKDAVVKKILPNVEIVKSIQVQSDSVESQKEQELDDAVSQEVANASLSVPMKNAIKVFLWWKKDAQANYKRIIRSHTAEDEDFLQKAKRRLKKYEKAQMYTLFEPKWFGLIGNPLEKYKHQDFDLTKENVEVYIDTITIILDTILTAPAEEIDDNEINELVEDVNIIEEMSRLEAIAQQLMLDGIETIDFLDEARSHVSTLENLLKNFSPTDIILLKDNLGEGSWAKFLSLASLAGSNLFKFAKESGGPQRLVARFKKYQILHPMHLMKLVEINDWSWAQAKPMVIDEIKSITKTPKVTEHTLTLFHNKDILKDISQLNPDLPELSSPVSISVVVNLTANTPEELEYGLDNPYIAQLVYDAADYSKLYSKIRDEYARLITNSGYTPEYSEEKQKRILAQIKPDLEKVIDAEQAAAAARAEKAAKIEFGRAAEIISTRRWQKVELTLSTIKIGIGVVATVAAGLTSFWGGVLAAQGVAKAVVSFGYDIRSFNRSFTENMEKFEIELDYIKVRIQSVGEPDAQIESAVWATFLTDVMNPWKKAEKYAENAKNCLSEMHVKAAEMSQGINDLLELSQHVSESYQRMKTEMAALDPKANEELIRSLTKQLLSIDSHLDSHSTSVQSAFDGCASYLATISKYQKVFDSIYTAFQKVKPSGGTKVFLKMWEFVDWAGGIVAGGYVAEDTLAAGLDPFDPQGWITVSNFASYTSNLDDLRLWALSIRNEVFSNDDQ